MDSSSNPRQCDEATQQATSKTFTISKGAQRVLDVLVRWRKANLARDKKPYSEATLEQIMHATRYERRSVTKFVAELHAAALVFIIDRGEESPIYFVKEHEFKELQPFLWGKVRRIRGRAPRMGGERGKMRPVYTQENTSPASAENARGVAQSLRPPQRKDCAGGSADVCAGGSADVCAGGSAIFAPLNKKELKELKAAAEEDAAAALAALSKVDLHIFANRPPSLLAAVLEHVRERIGQSKAEKISPAYVVSCVKRPELHSFRLVDGRWEKPFEGNIAAQAARENAQQKAQDRRQSDAEALNGHEALEAKRRWYYAIHEARRQEIVDHVRRNLPVYSPIVHLASDHFAFVAKCIIKAEELYRAGKLDGPPPPAPGPTPPFRLTEKENR